MRNNVTGSKIQAPKVSSAFLLRNRLLKRLTAEEKKIFFLHATVGHGKTVLLTQFASKTDAMCAWYHLSDTDNDIMTFMQYLCEAVKKVACDLSFDWSSYGGLMQSEEMLNDMLCDFSAYLSEITAHTQKELLLIFDDFQTITNEEVYQLLEVISKNTSAKVKLFAATKGTIPSFFMRYLLQGTAEIISQQELCFQEGEVRELLSPLSGTVAEVEELTRLVLKHTEGWPAGVMFAVLYLKQNYHKMEYKDNSIIYEQTAVHGYIMHEIYRKLPYEIQIFLSETSVLDFLSADVCNAVTGRSNSQSTLDYLVQENLFILRMGYSDKVFRYHSLFKDFLSKQVKEERANEILNTAAAFYLNQQTNIENREQAVEYAIRSGNSTLVQYALEGIGMELLNRGKLATLERWIAFLTAKELKLTSQNMLISGVFFYQKGNVGKALIYIDQAKEMFLSAMDENGYVRCMLEKANMIRNAMSLEESNLILDQIMPRLRNKSSVLLFAATKERLYNFLFLCKYREALAICSETILTARRLGNKRIERQFVLISIVIYFYMGKYGRALELYDTFAKKDVPEANQTEPFSVNAYAALMMAFYGRESEAKRLIDEELEQRMQQKKKEDIWIVYLFKACIYFMAVSHKRNGGEIDRKKAYSQAFKALNIAEKYMGYWAEKHVFYGYVKGIKTILSLNFTTLQYDKRMEQWMAEWENIYPFARNFSMGNLVLGLYNNGEREKALEYGRSFLKRAETEDLFTVYGRAVVALMDGEEGDRQAAVKGAVLVQSYLLENKLQLVLFSEKDRKRLEDLAAEEQEKDTDVFVQVKKIRVKAFGEFEVYLPRAETPLKFRTKKAQELFSYLFHLRGRAVTKETIMLQLWPESGEKNGTSLLHTTIYSIRKVLQGSEMEELITYKDKKYTMDMRMVHSDLAEVGKLAMALDRGAIDEIRGHREWMDAYGGSYLADINCEFAAESRAYYERRYLKFCRVMAQREIQEENYEAATYYLIRALHIDSYEEELHLLLIRCYSKLGDMKSVKQCYENMNHILSEELSIEPSLSLNELLKGCTMGNYKEKKAVIRQ